MENTLFVQFEIEMTELIESVKRESGKHVLIANKQNTRAGLLPVTNLLSNHVRVDRYVSTVVETDCIWKDSNINRRTKQTAVDSGLFNVLLWFKILGLLIQNIWKKIEPFVMWPYRRMLRISWMEKKPINSLLKILVFRKCCPLYDTSGNPLWDFEEFKSITDFWRMCLFGRWTRRVTLISEISNIEEWCYCWMIWRTVKDKETQELSLKKRCWKNKDTIPNYNKLHCTYREPGLKKLIPMVQFSQSITCGMETTFFFFKQHGYLKKKSCYIFCRFNYFN